MSKRLVLDRRGKGKSETEPMREFGHRFSGALVPSTFSGALSVVLRGAVIGLSCLLSCGLQAEEPAGSFLQALRENGYYDMALLYLDRMDGSSLVTPEFQSELAFQRGVTMVQAATRVRSRSARERMLNEAKTNLERFLAQQPDSPKRLFARRQFILLLHEWAKMKTEAANRTGDAALLKEAGELYSDVHAASVKATDELKNELTLLKKDDGVPAEREEIEYRDSLRGEYLLTLLRAAESLEEKAATESPDSPQVKKLLNDAIVRYEDMFHKYGDVVAGIRARLYQARCLQQLGDSDAALQILNDDLLIDTDNQLVARAMKPADRMLKTRAMLLAIECWTGEPKGDYAMAVSRGTPWLETIRPAENEEENWILLRLALARAHKRLADQIAQKDPRDEVVKSSREAARRLARVVSRLPSDHQDAGRVLLTEIPGGVAAARTTTQEPAKTFEEARVRGSEALSDMQNAESMLAIIPGRLRVETDEEVKKELQQKLKDSAEAIQLKRLEARENLLLALSFADADTPVEDLNLVRRLLAYLYYVDGDFFDAAVMGEFIGRRFPGSSGARLGAQIALAAYLKLYETSPSEDREFETAHVVSLANYIVETWSGTPEAADAINTLIPFLIRQGKLDKAREYVENIPETSLERGSAELRIGEALWRDYLLGMQQLREWQKAVRAGDAGADELKPKIAAREPELLEVRKTALQILESGVERMRQADAVEATVPRAVLALAQIYVDIDKAPQAIALLDDPAIGVLPMIERGDSVMESSRLQEQAYRVALSAFVSALPKVNSSQQRAALVERSEALIQTLREQVGDTPEDQKRLVNIFVSLARGMETQLKLLDEPEDRRVLSSGFRTFLEQVRDEAEDLKVLEWVAASFSSLGKGLADDAQSIDESQACFASAIATYDAILADAEKHALTPELTQPMQYRKAMALRQSKQYAKAYAVLEPVLEADNKRLEYQQEAARIYQLWAAEPKEGKRFQTAVIGSTKDTQTNAKTMWGWSLLASRTQRYKTRRDDFYEARYNTGVCYYELARRLRAKSDRQKYLGKAKSALVMTYRMYPTLGGRVWYTKYDAMLKKIQRALGEQPVGLKPSRKK